MMDNKCKKCRRAGEKLFLRGDKCYTVKCPFSRKPYVPGSQGKKTSKRRRGLSEYGTQLREKQKVKFSYGVLEKQFKNYVLDAHKKGSEASQKLYDSLESRLDNIVFRLGFAESKAKARQMVSHGHIIVNSRKVDIPSYSVKTGSKVGIKQQSLAKGIAKDLDNKLKKYNPPIWLNLDKGKKEGEVIAKPSSEDASIISNLNSIIGFYSR